ncbi:MAG: sugar ABC transporter substrate-binding protein [Solibacterales bacterium]|nr:sugar ABC transporter substrate-binding protein [Bryobacterales bacterium]|tara:strand:+ start:414 stop:1391 length:978 start_codon:yes stop_codon:yes gene_type:complete
MMHTRRRCWPLLALAVLATFVICACGQSDRTRIGVIPKAVAHVFWKSVHAGAIAAGREADVDIEWKGPPTETDFSRQIEIVDSMINARVDGIVLAPTEATALSTVVERANRQGIPVTIFDSAINTDKYVSFVSTNNYDAGVLAARQLAKLLNSKGRVIVVKMVPGSASTTQREKGFEETLTREFPGVQILAEQYCMADRARALAVSENMLTAHPNVDGMFASAEPATIGAAKALRSRGLDGRVRLVGFDFSDTIEKDLRDGAIDALVVQDPFNIGYEAVKTIVAKIGGKTPKKRIDSPATVVTLDNLADPTIDALVHPDLDKYLP